MSGEFIPIFGPETLQSIMRGPTLGGFLGAAGSVLGLTPMDTFYPPLNQTSYIANASAGTYGGLYQAGNAGPTGGSPYGVYNYCSMPHPREYQLPDQAANNNANLIKLIYLQRHQRRTPYNILPGGEVRIMNKSF